MSFNKSSIPQRQAETLALMSEIGSVTIELACIAHQGKHKSTSITSPTKPTIKVNGATWIAMKEKGWVSIVELVSLDPPYKARYEPTGLGLEALAQYERENSA